eukprot:6839349-Pyramimonas_sp.AAC.2
MPYAAYLGIGSGQNHSACKYPGPLCCPPSPLASPSAPPGPIVCRAHSPGRTRGRPPRPGSAGDGVAAPIYPFRKGSKRFLGELSGSLPPASSTRAGIPDESQ